MTNRERLRVQHILYANILASFAFFHNPKYRGPDFSWDWWVENCVDSVEVWLLVHFKFVGPDMLRESQGFARAVAKVSVERMCE